jgi:hypothetical protein
MSYAITMRKELNAMKWFIANGYFVAVLGMLVLATGCASHYYKVTEPISGSVFYTKEIDNEKGGAVKLKDARTGSMVTIQNSEVKEISKQEFFVGINTPTSKPTTTTPSAPPAAAPAAAPATAPAPAEAPAQVPPEQPKSAPSGT